MQSEPFCPVSWSDGIPRQDSAPPLSPLQVGKINLLAAQRREQHILLMVLSMVSCYMLCWMPYGVTALMATFGKSGLVTPMASVVPSILAKFSTVVNPVIYVFLNNQVRADSSICKKKKEKKKDHREVMFPLH